MKSLLQQEYVVLAVRLFLGFLFIVASIEKIADPNAFAVSIGYYKLVGMPAALVIATILPWVELLSGVFLMFGIMPRGSSLLMALMMIGFTVAVLSGVLRGLDISCGCFTRDPSVGRIGWMKILENCGLLCLSVFTLFANTKKFVILNSQPPASGESHAG
jgi:uncharacterized membrane protein YphA (DoxX/SURF4 family)